jgi:hypothetical protein
MFHLNANKEVTKQIAAMIRAWSHILLSAEPSEHASSGSVHTSVSTTSMSSNQFGKLTFVQPSVNFSLYMDLKMRRFRFIHGLWVLKYGTLDCLISRALVAQSNRKSELVKEYGSVEFAIRKEAD